MSDTTMPPEPYAHRPALDEFIKRLIGSISRSSLLKIRTSKSSNRLLDVKRLEVVERRLPGEVLQGVTAGARPVPVQLDLRALQKRDEEADNGDLIDAAEGHQQISDSNANEHLRLYKALDRMSSDAEMVRRETGRHALWLGYPLLHAVGEGEILAPVFLWPIDIRLDHRHQGRVHIGRAEIPPQFNRVMSAWVQRQLHVQVADISGGDLAEFDLEQVQEELKNIAQQFHPSLWPIDCRASLEPIPVTKSLEPRASPRLFNSAVIGYFRWQNESILADLEILRSREGCPGLAGDILRGADLPTPPLAPDPDENDRYLVHDADFSQARVVWQARMPPGLVVHGPPGTGKSQTIVNVIADALAHDRTVLMVCQKQAATRVVMERLRAVGLRDLCMEVHDATANRQEVFKEIRDQVAGLHPRVTKVLQVREDLSRQIVEKEQLLDRYAKAFHEQHPRIGSSYKQILSREGHLQAKFPTLRELTSLHAVLGKLSVAQIEEIHADVMKVGQLFHESDALSNPWRRRQATVMADSPALRNDVHAALAELRQLDSVHADHIQAYGAGPPFPADVSGFAAAASELATQLEHLHQSESLFRIARAWAKIIAAPHAKELQVHCHRCERAIEAAERVSSTSTDSRWAQVCDPLPSSELHKLHRNARKVVHAGSSWWRRLLCRQARRELDALRPHGVSQHEAATSLLAHLDAKEARAELKNINTQIVPPIRPADEDGNQVKFPKLAREALEHATLLRQQPEWFRPVVDRILNDQGQLQPSLDELERLISRAPLVNKLFKALSDFEAFLLPEAVEEGRSIVRSGKSIHDWLEAVFAGFGKLAPLVAWEADTQQRQFPRRETLEALETYEARLAAGDKLPQMNGTATPGQHGEWWAALVEYTAILTWKRECLGQHPVLLQVTPPIYEKTREELATLLYQKRRCEAEAILERRSWHQFQAKGCPWARWFQLRSSAQHKAPRMREAIIASLKNLLAMRPCWLVNPEAAAQIFPLEPGIFDLVIFDEASQCPVEQAVPAIYRGKSLIVAGDAKQLPPTDFFSASIGGTGGEKEDDENGQDEEATSEPVQDEAASAQKKLSAQFLLQVEDLLETAIASLRPPAADVGHLMVHYRSEHPDLIEFSNQAFYHGQLESPPSRLSSQTVPRPVVHIDVGGLYADRANRQEAAAVVQLLKGHWAPEAQPPTIGVVTFNYAQRELVESMIEEACQSDAAFAARYEQEKSRTEDNQDVGFFVKNLENVQGDERDVMIFSTTFGRNSDGRFFRRFGPVAAKGGERRLNVAVTRAKQRVIVVSSMPINEISDALAGGASPGTGITPAGYLQLYLAYAKAVSEGDRDGRAKVLSLLSRHVSKAQPDGEAESPLEIEVRQALEKQGHLVHSQVGESGFRIDLAVLHPEPKRGYVLGIECDGAAYHSDRSARLRDVWREGILRKRGWRIHRIWSTRWWYERAEELTKLHDTLLEAVDCSDQAAARNEADEDEPPATGVQGSTATSDSARMPPTNEQPSPDRVSPSHWDEGLTLAAIRHAMPKRVSWEKFLASLGLPLGKGITNAMTLAEARKIAGPSAEDGTLA
jgi:hypothetical protein